METGTLIVVMGLCITLACITQVISRAFDRMDWLEEKFSSLKDDNGKAHMEFNKFYTEVMGLLSDQHNEMRDVLSRLDSLENRIKEDEDNNYDDICGLRSQLNGMDYRIKKNEEDSYKNIKDNEKYFDRQINCLKDMHSNLACAIAEHNKTLNEIRTEMLSKEMLNKMEEKEENE